MSTKPGKKFYQGVSREEIQNFQQFKQTHRRKQLDCNGQGVEYLSCGQGEKTIFLPPGGFGIIPPEYGFRSILHFEKKYKVISPDIPRVGELAKAHDIFNKILDAEGTEKVTVVGGSGSGIIAQSYFKRNFDRVEAMVLYNTPAPQKKPVKKRGLRIIRLFPGFILRPLLIRKANKLLEAKIPPEALDRVRFSAALLKDMLSSGFSKQALRLSMQLAMEFSEIYSYEKEDFKGWQGKVLVITAEDDAYFKDVDDLMKNLPNTQLYTFPKGSGHIAFHIYPDKFFGLIDEFLEKM